MENQYIYNLTLDSLPNSVGSKASNLRKLRDMGFKIPSTYCCTWDAYVRFQDHGEKVLKELREEIIEIIDLEKTYAVRSSTDLEDRHEYTYAGQFKTILDIKGLDSVLKAIREVWQSSQTRDLQFYRSQLGVQNTLPKNGCYPAGNGITVPLRRRVQQESDHGT